MQNLSITSFGVLFLTKEKNDMDTAMEGKRPNASRKCERVQKRNFVTEIR